MVNGMQMCLDMLHIDTVTIYYLVIEPDNGINGILHTHGKAIVYVCVCALPAATRTFLNFPLTLLPAKSLYQAH